MSKIYVYDQTVYDIYSEESFGLITSFSDSSEDYGQITASVTSYDDWYLITRNSTQTPFGSIYISGGYNNLKFSASSRNTQIFSISGSSLDSYQAQTPENTQLFSISGSSLNSYQAQTPENTQLFSISGGYSNLKFISNPPENTQLFSISGGYSNLKFSASSRNTQLFNISGGYNNLKFISNNDKTSGNIFIVGSAEEVVNITPVWFGSGVIYLQGTNGNTINNPYQIPRSYVVII